MYRQGDILLVSAQAIPLTAVKQADGVIATGEATGHRHELVGEASVWIDADETKYIRVIGSTACLRHEEHASIRLYGPATYRMIRQREYRPGAVFYVED